VERFAEEMDTLLEITLRSNLVEKLSMALYDCLFEEEDEAESKVCVVECIVVYCVVLLNMFMCWDVLYISIYLYLLFWGQWYSL